MKPKTIHHPEALADWRANDERPQKTTTGETYATYDNTIPKKQKKPDGLLALRLKEAIEQETRKRGEVRKEREA